MGPKPTKRQSEQDSKLVHRAQQGDRQAFEELANRYRRALLAVARARVGDGEAEDLAQEVLVQAWKKLAHLRDPNAFPAWLNKLTVNACRQWHRRAANSNVSLDVSAVPAPDTPDPLDELLRMERSNVLREALYALPEDNRRALIMHLWGQYAYSEIAERTGVPLSTVEGRIYRAKTQMRRLLGLLKQGLPARAVRIGGSTMAEQAVVTAKAGSESVFIPQLGVGGMEVVAVSPDGSRFASAGSGSALIIWNTASGRQELRLMGAGDIRSLCFSADGRLLAIYAYASDIIIYDVENGERLFSLPVNAGAMQFDEDGRLWTASWTPDPEAKPESRGHSRTNIFCWDLSSKQVIRRIENLAGSPAGFSSDLSRVMTHEADLVLEKRILLRAENVCLLVWDIHTGQMVSRLEELPGYGCVNAISRDGSLAAASSWDEKTSFDVFVWNTSTGRLLYTLSGHKDTVGALDFAPDGSVLVSASLDGGIFCRDTSDGSILSRFDAGVRIDAIAFTPDGQRLITRAPNGTGIGVWDWREGKPLASFTHHSTTIRAAAFAPDSSKLILSGGSSHVLAWDCRNGQLLVSDDIPERPSVISLGCDPSSRLAIGSTVRYTGEDGSKPMSRVVLWDLEQMGVEHITQEWEGTTHEVAFSPAGRLAAGIWGRRYRVKTGMDIFIADVASRSIIHRISQPGPYAYFHDLAFSPDGSRIAACCAWETPNGSYDSGEIRLWDVDSGELVRIWEDTRAFDTISFSPDGRTIAAGMAYPPPGNDRICQVRMYDAETGQKLWENSLPEPLQRPEKVIFSPDSSLLASCTLLGQLQLWDPSTGKLLRSLDIHTTGISVLLFSPDTRLLVTADYDGFLSLWPVSDLLNEPHPREVATLAVLDNGSNWLAYTPDSHYDCSPEAEPYLLWRTGNEFLTVKDCAAEYHRPGLVAEVLQS